MELGAFSISLAVRDIAASRAFYEDLGFSVFAGDETHKWLIMRNGVALIGLFQGVLERNTLTFNPGWNQNAEPLERYLDVREIERRLRMRGVPLRQSLAEGSSGPGHILAVDPDGNPILIDQHVGG